MSKKIHFIINPASGQPYPVLHTINSVCAEYDCQWSVSVTQKDNLLELSKEAAKSDAEIIAVYGGDGTLAAVAGVLHKTEKILGILPGGTANVLSAELDVPQDIREACKRICLRDHKIARVDMGKICDQYFLLRVGLGFEAEMVKGAGRSAKTKMGWLAYAFASLKAALNTKLTKYHMTLDGKKVHCRGLSLIIANSGNLGLPGVNLFSDIDVSDGMFNVILIRPADLKLLFSEGNGQNTENAPMSLFQHWHAKEISIEAGHKQKVQYDGEIFGSEAFDISVLPGAIQIIR